MFARYKWQLAFYWLMLSGLIVFGIFVCWDNGLVTIVLGTDQSKISFVIASVFIAGTFHCCARAIYVSTQINQLRVLEKIKRHPDFASGNPSRRRLLINNSGVSNRSISLSYLAQSNILDINSKTSLSNPSALLDILTSKAKNSHDTGWFMVDILIKLGLLGTIIGFIFMLASVSVTDSMDVASLKSIIKSMSNGMGTALYTTLTGLVASMILAIQYLLVERGSDCLIERSIQLAIDFSNPEDSV
jgi:hypothetical protein